MGVTISCDEIIKCLDLTWQFLTHLPFIISSINCHSSEWFLTPLSFIISSLQHCLRLLCFLVRSQSCRLSQRKFNSSCYSRFSHKMYLVMYNIGGVLCFSWCRCCGRHATWVRWRWTTSQPAQRRSMNKTKCTASTCWVHSLLLSHTRRHPCHTDRSRRTQPGHFS
jgi:hypothetical protein